MLLLAYATARHALGNVLTLLNQMQQVVRILVLPLDAIVQSVMLSTVITTT